MTTPSNSAPEPFAQPGQPGEPTQPSSPYAASAPDFDAQAQPGSAGGPTYAPGAPVPNAAPAPAQQDTAKPVFGIVLGLIGAAIFGLTYLTWASIGGLEEWAAYYTEAGQPTSVNSLAYDMGLNSTSANGRVEEFTGLWVGFIGLGIAVLGGTLRQGTLAAFGGLIGAAGSLAAGIVAFLSYNTISGWNDEIAEGFVGVDFEQLGLPMPQFEVGIGLWLTFAVAIVGVVVGVLAYTTRNRVNPPSGPGITASDSGASPAPGLF